MWNLGWDPETERKDISRKTVAIQIKSGVNSNIPIIISETWQMAHSYIEIILGKSG